MNEKQNVTLNELSGGTVNGNKNLREVNPMELKPPKKEEETNILVKDAFAGLNDAVNRIEKESDEFLKQKAEYEEQEQIEKELNDDEDELNDEEEEELEKESSDADNKIATTKEPVKNLKVVDKSEEDIEELKEEELDEMDDEEQRNLRFEQMKKEIKKTINPISNKIDINSFKIVKKNMSVASALKTVKDNKVLSDWALFNKGEVVSMTEFSGKEIEMLNPRTSNRNLINTYTSIYNLIYSHVATPNKPMTMEEWVKGIPFIDLDHLYMAIYKASYSRANYIPYECEHCKHVFVSKDIEIKDMVKYKDDETKEKAEEVLAREAVCKPNEIDVELVQISDDYIIGMRTPSIYNVVFENAVLDPKFSQKYANFLTTVSYIDSLYYIDRENQALRQIEIEVFPDNLRKTVKNRIIKISKIINTLNSDQLAILDTIIEEKEKVVDDISYVIPEYTCPECGEKIKEKLTTATDMLFTRHQLTNIANM